MDALILQESTMLKVLLAALAGVAIHLLYFIHGEHHMDAPRIMWGHVFAFGLVLWMESAFQPTYWRGITIILAYLTALFTSIVVYRKFFHRLRKFPGPVMAGVTKLWPEVKWAVDGPQNNCRKAVWYDILLPTIALNTTRSKADHDQRRRAWDQAMNARAMEGYESRIRAHVLRLEQDIENEDGRPINITDWIAFLAFDVMGDFAFAKSFDMLERKEWRYPVNLLRRALRLLGPFSPVPWMAQIAFSLPIIPLIRDWNRMLRWCSAEMTEMVERIDRSTTKTSNISAHLIQYSQKHNSLKDDELWLTGDSFALIGAGSDTVASTLIYLFYRLALHPEHAMKIQDEVANLNDLSDSQSLSSLPHLDGCINETMRMHPPVPTGGYRETGPEGLEVAGTYIPGNVTIVAPRYTLGRLESSYEQPHEFVPERWYSRPEMVANKQSFDPFSLGRYTCVGKKLAMVEMRYTVALLLSKYDVAFAPGEDGVAVVRDMMDQLTAVAGKLMLSFTPRKQA